MRRHYLITYDISSEHRLRRVHGIVRDFGQPVQYSVFLAQLDGLQKAELLRQLGHVIHHEHDQILLFDLGRAHGRHELELPTHEGVGRPLAVETKRALIL
ncbi:CRISPR-associated endonuclease Cas2 [Pseudenhygromyxa sp. WMMC2535]|uniref:CRISPR-associated endonuclease Cas2 n=1 Tax=Pseudenhygromyxa sp. WMMC2535 TaxID=2712867 RepID=UPI0015523B7F|nr:CRISPR-associated endonuclease Cas2 [Pseudenhygromyxa sp. WMMC2535]NVB39798.1 CRISPR-associated endonuclease Cas2 [Pseudenhygromyxa sp. WMMC2535]